MVARFSVLLLLLLAVGCSQTAEDGDPRKLFVEAVQAGDTTTVRAMIAQSPDLVHEMEPLNSRTPLHVAAIAGDAEMVSLLLTNGADPTVTDLDGQRPADLAFAHGASQDVIDLLKVD